MAGNLKHLFAGDRVKTLFMAHCALCVRYSGSPSGVQWVTRLF